MSRKQLIYDTLTDMGVSFRLVEHQAVFTVEEMQSLNFPAKSQVPKNLFLRDSKGKRHFLIVAAAKQAINLKQMEQVLGSTKLSFASEGRLQKYLGLTKGSVSPLGLINDTEHAVELYFDKKLCEADTIGVHPNDNTATVFMSYDSLIKFFGATGHPVNLIDFSI